MSDINNTLLEASEEMLGASENAEQYYEQVKAFEKELLSANELYIKQFKQQMEEHQKLVETMMLNANAKINLAPQDNDNTAQTQTAPSLESKQFFEPTN